MTRGRRRALFAMVFCAMGLAACGGDANREVVTIPLPPPHTIAFDVTAAPPSPASRLSVPGAALAGLPADTWAAVGFRNLGARVKRAIEQIDSLGAAIGVLQRRLQHGTAIDFNRDVLSWLGNTTLFVEGASKASAQGALVLGSTNPQASLNAIRSVFGPVTPKLRLPGGGTGLTIPPSPAYGGNPLHIVERGNQVVLAIGDRAGEQAFAPSKTLADDPVFQRAQASLIGFSQVAYVSMAPALRYVESTGARRKPDYRRVKRYLTKFDFVAIGTRSARDRDIIRTVLGLHVR